MIESEYLFRRPWLTARRDKVQLPDGRIHPEFYVLEYPDWVNVIAITTDGQFVMERQYRHALGKTCYEMPCGVVEQGEELLTAAKRELQEETGFGGGEWRHFLSLSPNPSSNTNMSHTFIATRALHRGRAGTSSPLHRGHRCGYPHCSGPPSGRCWSRSLSAFRQGFPGRCKAGGGHCWWALGA